VKIKNVRDLSTDELRQKDKNIAEELFRLRIRHSSGQIESPAIMKNLRKDIARIKTVLRQREGEKV
jgi:large subunit ribosomal protein L29